MSGSSIVTGSHLRSFGWRAGENVGAPEGLADVGEARGAHHDAPALGVTGEIGTLLPGRHADCVAVKGDPQPNLDALASPRAVARNGRGITIT